MTDRELMQEALYALTYVGDAKEIYSDTIESLRARLANEFNPDWDAMAVMVEEQQRMAAENETLKRCLFQMQEAAKALVEKQEPVAQVRIAEDYHAHVFWMVSPLKLDQRYLYAAPPQREWQGLTDEEIDETAWPYFIGNIMPSVKIIVRQLEAKLKEKNT